MFDSDSDGYISGEEIKRLFQAVGCNLTDKELNNIMKMGDKDGNVNKINLLFYQVSWFISIIQHFHIFQKASEYDQEMRQSHTAAPRGRDTEH